MLLSVQGVKQSEVLAILRGEAPNAAHYLVLDEPRYGLGKIIAGPWSPCCPTDTKPLPPRGPCKVFRQASSMLFLVLVDPSHSTKRASLAPRRCE